MIGNYTTQMSAAARPLKARGSVVSALLHICFVVARRIPSSVQLVRLFTLVALLFAALGMTGSHAALGMSARAAAVQGTDHSQMGHVMMAHQKAAGMSTHCADVQSGEHKGEHKGSALGISCMIACSGILATPGAVAPVPITARMSHYVRLANPLHGLPAKADTPPPRSSDA